MEISTSLNKFFLHKHGKNLFAHALIFIASNAKITFDIPNLQPHTSIQGRREPNVVPGPAQI